MDRRAFLLGSALVAVGGLAATEARADTWYSLGKLQVNGLVDHDRFTVGANAGVFNAIRLKVTGNDLMIYDLDVRYGNGANDDIPVRLLIPQGGQTRVIDLRARNRFIRFVDIEYGKFANLQGATWVELLGRKS